MNNLSNELKNVKTYCINLKKRKDRKIKMKRMARKKKIKFTLIKGIEGGHIGCKKTHCQIIKNAVKNKHDIIWVMEDDIKIVAPLQIKECPKNWDILFLGGEIIKKYNLETTNKEWIRCQSHFTHSYIINLKNENLVNDILAIENNDDMTLRVQSVTMPGKNITTTPNDNAYGPSYEMANGISYAEEIEVTFILDQDHKIREWFNDWQDKIVDPSNYDLSYYDQYIGEMRIYQLDQNEQAASAVQVHEVYPKSVGPIAYSMESGNSFVTVTVNMAFRNWTPLVVAFFGVDDAVWLQNEKAMPRKFFGGILDAAYKLSSTYGIAIPSNVQDGLNKLSVLDSAMSNPLQLLKRVVQQKIGSRLGRFGL